MNKSMMEVLTKNQDNDGKVDIVVSITKVPEANYAKVFITHESKSGQSYTVHDSTDVGAAITEYIDEYM